MGEEPVLATFPSAAKIVRESVVETGSRVLGAPRSDDYGGVTGALFRISWCERRQPLSPRVLVAEQNRGLQMRRAPRTGRWAERKIETMHAIIIAVPYLFLAAVNVAVVLARAQRVPSSD